MESFNDKFGVAYKMLLERVVLFKLIKKFIIWTLEYTGPLAEIVKAIPVALMATFILSPIFVYPMLMMWAQALGEPGCYFLYALWWLMFFAFAISAAVMGYLREKAREEG